MSSRSAVLASMLLLAACKRSTDEGDAGAIVPTPSASASAELAAPSTVEPDRPLPVASAEPAFALPPPVAEASRRSLRGLAAERALVPHEGLLRAHFGGALPSPVELQTAALAGDRRAFLAYDEPRRRNPFLLVTSASGELFWTKEHPLAGTRQVVTEMVVTPGPHGEVALLWCDIPTQVVGLRRWAADGVVLADFAVVEVDLCEALSGLYWPGHGWVAVASQHGSPARAQLLDESGRRAWGTRGSELAWSARPSSPVSIAVDADDSVILFQVGDLRREPGSAAPDRVLAMRYDALGAPLWERPLDLGAAPAGAVSRITARRAEPGHVQVALGAKTLGKVTSRGSILDGR